MLQHFIASAARLTRIALPGHLLGAAGAVEAVATIMALQTGMLHPNPNLKNPDPKVDLNVLVGATAQKHAVRNRGNTLRACAIVHATLHAHRPPRAQVDVALSNSFGFGGHNSCILFAAYKP